jgi:hypothetical protein
MEEILKNIIRKKCKGAARAYSLNQMNPTHIQDNPHLKPSTKELNHAARKGAQNLLPIDAKSDSIIRTLYKNQNSSFR